MSCTCFRVNLHCIVVWMSKKLLEKDAISEVLSDLMSRNGWVFRAMCLPVRVPLLSLIIFSDLNPKPDDTFLSYNMPEVLNNTEHGLTDIIIAWNKF